MNNIPLSIYSFNVRTLGISFLTDLGRKKLSYIFETVQKKNAIVILVEISLARGYLPSLPSCARRSFDLVHGNADGKGSGMMIFCSKDIVKNSSLTLVIGRLSILNVTCGSNFEFNLVCAYMPHTNKEAYDIFGILKKYVNDNNLLSSRMLLAGDWNFDAERYSDHAGRQNMLQDILNSFSPRLIDAAEQFNEYGPTWIGDGVRGLHSFSRIDKFYCNFLDNFNHFKSVLNPYSDHRYILLSYRKKNDAFVPAWSDTLFADRDFEREALILSAKILIENSTLDLSSVAPNDWTNHKFADGLDYASSGDQDTMYIPVFSLLLSKLLHLNSKKAREKSQKTVNEMRDFCSQYDKLFKTHLSNPSLETLKMLEEIKRNSKNAFTLFYENKRKNNHIQHLYNDGRSNTETFRPFKNRKSHPTRLIKEGKTISDPDVLLDNFFHHHKRVTSEKIQYRPNFDQLIDNFNDFFGVNFDDLFDEKFEVSGIITTYELRSAIKTMSSSSARGPSGQGKQLFLFFLKFFPIFFTSLINEVIRKDISRTSLSYLKVRSVIFIPKKGPNSATVNDYRPISLLEVMYKLISKALVNKIEKHLPSIVSSNQFGFVKSRRMSNATLSVLGSVNEVRCRSEGLIMFLDIAKAFDSIRHDLMDRVINLIFPDTDFASLWLRWTNVGQAHVAISNLKSQDFSLTVGVGQGDSSSSAKYIILHSIFAKIFQSPKLAHLLFTLENGSNILPLAFADDTVLTLEINSEEDVLLLHEAFQKIGELTGLYINPSKTAILCPKGAYIPSNIEMIGSIKNHAQHLGLIISMDSDKGYELTYNQTLKKMRQKSNAIYFRHGDNLLKRKLIVNTMISSCLYHVYPVYLPRPPEIKEIIKIVTRSLWGTHITHKKRAKIAADRIEFPLNSGGLGIWNPMRRAVSSFLAAFVNSVAYIHKAPDSNLARICVNKDISLYKYLLTMGSASLNGSQVFFTTFYPKSTFESLNLVKNTLINIEKHPAFFFRSSLQNSIFATKGIGQLFKLSNEDCAHLMHEEAISVGDIMSRTPIGKGQFMFSPVLHERFTDGSTELSTRIIDILKNIVKNVSHFVPPNKMLIFSEKRFRFSIKPMFYHATFCDKSFFAKTAKKLLFDETESSYPPALDTRIRDNVESFDKETIMKSFSRILQAKLPLKLKSFHVEFIFRTLPSRNKLCKFKLAETSRCGRCLKTADTEHILFYCDFPSFCMKMIAKFLDHTFNRGIPRIHLCRQKWFLYNIYTEEIPQKAQSEITNLALLIKKFCIVTAAEDKWRTWNQTVFFAQLMSQIKRVILQRKYLHLSTDILQALYDFIVKDFAQQHS